MKAETVEAVRQTARKIMREYSREDIFQIADLMTTGIIAALNEKLATVRDFLVYYASCPCCQALEKCADDCTFENDVPADHEVMTQAREILREVGHD